MFEINEKATEILNILIDELTLEHPSKKIDNRPGVFMAVCVEFLNSTSNGDLFSVTHYFEQNGDLMSDPDIVFLRGQNNRFSPVSFQQDSMGIYQESVTFACGGGIESFDFELQKSLASFTATWMENIADQQQLIIKGS